MILTGPGTVLSTEESKVNKTHCLSLNVNCIKVKLSNFIQGENAVCLYLWDRENALQTRIHFFIAVIKGYEGEGKGRKKTDLAGHCSLMRGGLTCIGFWSSPYRQCKIAKCFVVALFFSKGIIRANLSFGKIPLAAVWKIDCPGVR
jgi:hypothetical protein